MQYAQADEMHEAQSTHEAQLEKIAADAAAARAEIAEMAEEVRQLRQQQQARDRSESQPRSPSSRPPLGKSRKSDSGQGLDQNLLDEVRNIAGDDGGDHES